MQFSDEDRKVPKHGFAKTPPDKVRLLPRYPYMARYRCRNFFRRRRPGPAGVRFGEQENEERNESFRSAYIQLRCQIQVEVVRI